MRCSLLPGRALGTSPGIDGDRLPGGVRTRRETNRHGAVVRVISDGREVVRTPGAANQMVPPVGRAVGESRPKRVLCASWARPGPLRAPSLDAQKPPLTRGFAWWALLGLNQ